MSRPDLCHYGNGQKYLISPGRRTLDASIFKKVIIAERVKTQLSRNYLMYSIRRIFEPATNIGFVSNQSLMPDALQAGINLRGTMRIIQFEWKISF